MPHSDAIDAAANCPQCRAAMVHVAITPHPVARGMQRSIYMCSPCGRTQTYMLPAAAAGDAEPQRLGGGV